MKFITYDSLAVNEVPVKALSICNGFWCTSIFLHNIIGNNLQLYSVV